MKDRIQEAADESRLHNTVARLQAEDMEHLEDVLDALQALAGRQGLESECAYQHPGAGECWAYDPASPAPSTEWRVSVSASNVE